MKLNTTHPFTQVLKQIFKVYKRLLKMTRKALLNLTLKSILNLKYEFHRENLRKR